jgi:hypothetical protein
MLQGRDLANEYQSGISLAPATRTSSANGTGIDFRDCGPDVVSILSVASRAAVLETVGTCAIKLEESDNDSDYTAITGATHTSVARVAQTSANDSIEVKCFATRSKRYVRAVATIAGTSPSFTFGVALAAPKSSY